ncbi:NAD(P)/FAD-dependent oxidoreductase [Sulfitobacter donghicola]|uniref:Oxidoreductase n=1 Tax=Sulfitobacter donghicola DSW-25 = KCTC 12864 = JCM 14565 TaxID=1300350 RepID=A0A073IN05_9RHOB|nr:FAD-dependent oxidoreductase [Sulfitobacter donghicola]KEJ90876.1 oxidoreductase [Sulfitobacter donghicola DSW-25 = KCTC 12864 = JCM 14565]KIN68156.1 FAD dependent oxidoreductase [Sulfitobacter donghicola DSW-25 = KCTC 12864 = JCM 14565]
MTDITIRGAGIFGLSIAWACVQRGASVQIVDPHGAGAGSSGGVVGALAPHVPENWNPKKAFQLESLLMAQAFWDEVQAEGGESAGYARTGRLQPIADEATLALAQRRCETARELWQDNATWEVIPAVTSDWRPISPSGYFIRDTLSAHMHPRRACSALVAALKSKGIHVLPSAPDKGAVLWATGVAGLEELSAGRTRVMGNGVKGQAAVLDFDASGLPQLFAQGVHAIPHLDGTIAIGSTSEREYTDPTSTDAQLDDVIAAARAAIPALAEAPVLSRWAGVRPRARSRAPMLGAWPDRSGHFIANGGFKIGFGMAPKIAQVMADLLLLEKDAIPEGFRVEDNL